ncbi:MAG: acetoacetate decarboxylase family protein [Desulfobacteraceae bacterium]|nr:acetoacetate decarboxylase family protein [Desulfobacteraceae bacterium]MBC2757312.1 acetoacetate decarboxylase family protein [Desulfobacteraceae bacterium]
MYNKDLFENITSYNEFKKGDLTWTLPLRYRKAGGFTTMYSASYDAVKSIMPSERLKPYRISPNRTLVMICAFDYQDTDVGPYGEGGTCIPTCIEHNGKKHRGLYIHYLPVTTELARVAGIESYGFPKFVTDMEHEHGSKIRSVKIKENDRHIMDMSVVKGGFAKVLSMKLKMFTVRNDEIIQSEFILQVVGRFKLFGKCDLTLGDHPMADGIRAYDIGKRPVMTGELLDGTLVLQEGVSLGRV